MNPELLRRVVVPAKEALTRGRAFGYLAELETTQWYPEEQLRDLQWAKIRQLLQLAYDQSPYYLSVFQRASLLPEDIRSFDDFANFPVLTKENVRDHFGEIRCRNAPSNLRTFRTGGTTGIPQNVLLESEAYQFWNAVGLRCRRWWGVEIGDRMVQLWGSSRDFYRAPGDRLKGRLAKAWSRLLNMRMISAYDLSPDALERDAALLRQYRPRIVYGYKSSILQLAKHLRRNRIAAPAGLQVVVCTTEPLFESERESIESAFGCRVANEYGCVEAGILAHECPDGGFHQIAETAYLELIWAGAPVSPGDLGEVVVTALNQRAFPLIRYKLGDVGRYSQKQCGCGRGLMLLQGIEGRKHDMIIGPNNRLFHGQMFQHVFDAVQGLDRFKVIQRTVDRLEILVVRRDNFSDLDLAHALATIRDHLGEGVTLQAEFVNSIPLEPSGKYRSVVSDVAADIL